MAPGCGGGPSSLCGNGVQEVGEQCDRGDQNGQLNVPCSAECKSISVLIPQLNVSWDLLSETGVALYKGAGCNDFDAPFVRVILDGPSPSDEVLDCGRHNKIYARLCAKGTVAPDGGECPLVVTGMYTASVQLLRADKTTPVSNVLTTKPVNVPPGQVTPVHVSFEMGDFIKQDYTGSLDFHASWGAAGVGCAAATPAVTGESLLLVRDGQTMAVVGVAEPLKTKLDGTVGSCFTSDNLSNTSESVLGLLWGKYNLTIKSADNAFIGTYPLFVGPNKQPQTFELLVLPPVVPDLGVVPDLLVLADLTAAPLDLTAPSDLPVGEMSATPDGGVVDLSAPADGAAGG